MAKKHFGASPQSVNSVSPKREASSPQSVKQSIAFCPLHVLCSHSYTAEEAHPEIVETAVLFLQDKALLPNKIRRVQKRWFVRA